VSAVPTEKNRQSRRPRLKKEKDETMTEENEMFNLRRFLPPLWAKNQNFIKAIFSFSSSQQLLMRTREEEEKNVGLAQHNGM
jgi:hypothetical protein